MPLLPPVTIATFPVRENSSSAGKCAPIVSNQLGLTVRGRFLAGNRARSRYKSSRGDLEQLLSSRHRWRDSLLGSGGSGWRGGGWHAGRGWHRFLGSPTLETGITC